MAWGRDRGAAWVSYAPLSLPIPSQAAKIPYAWEGMGRAGNLDIDTPALPHAKNQGIF